MSDGIDRQVDTTPGDSTMATRAQALLSSGLLDLETYARQVGKLLSPEEAAIHYMTEGEAAGFRPSEHFDPAFYGSAYPDVEQAGVNRLEHYIAFGKTESRYATYSALRIHVDLVRRSTDLPLAAPHMLNATSPLGNGLTVLEEYVAGGWRRNQRATTDFDDMFYYTAYHDVAGSGLPPIVHYIERGRKEGRFTRRKALEHWIQIISTGFDEVWYRQQRPELPPDADLIVDYLVYGRWVGLDPSPDFSVDSYLFRYPDIRASGMDPFGHYLQHGRGEGRSGQPAHLAVEAGDIPFDSGKPTLLIATHEASRTGAPLVALGLAEHLRADFNIIALTGHAGSLSPDFRSASNRVITGVLEPPAAARLFRDLVFTHDLSGLILNSAESFHLSEGALDAGVPSVGLIHEFAEYSSGHVRRVVEMADRAVFPAPLLLESAEKELRPFGTPTNTIVRHQGLLPSLPHEHESVDMNETDLRVLLNLSEETKIVLGAGWAQIRKGLDLFVQAAAEVRRHYGEQVRFVWVGGNHRPKSDLGYSVYVQETVERLELNANVFFLPQQTSLDLLLSLSDVFFLSSRLDPFPNVVLDACEAGKPIVCFDRATGVADEIKAGRVVGAAVSYVNVGEASTAISRFLAEGSGAGKENAELMRRDYRFGDYAGFVSSQLNDARAFHRHLETAVMRLESSGFFDSRFHDGSPFFSFSRLPAIRRYVARALKGLNVYNPRPGFSDNLYRSRHGLALTDQVVPLLHAIDRTPVDLRPSTHECVLLDRAPVGGSFKGHVALHCHFRESDRPWETAKVLVDSTRGMDIFVTATSPAKRVEAEYSFRHYRGGQVLVQVVPDRGPLAALLVVFPKMLEVNTYEVVGHFHEEPPTLIDDLGGTTKLWLAHNRNLLLSEARTRECIFSLFTDSTLGLVFAEDRHAVGWVGSRLLADKLFAAARPRPVSPEAPYFPLGAMFWARPSALAAFQQLKIDPADFRKRLPSEGTIVEALERMLPTICEAAGLRWCTVHAVGAGW